MPVTVVAAIGAASKLGVLVKGGAALEALGAVRTIALDKTGTLTANKPTVIDVATTGGTTRDHLLDVAAGLEARSEHPLQAEAESSRSLRSKRNGQRAQDSHRPMVVVWEWRAIASLRAITSVRFHSLFGFPRWLARIVRRSMVSP